MPIIELRVGGGPILVLPVDIARLRETVRMIDRASNRFSAPLPAIVLSLTWIALSVAPMWTSYAIADQWGQKLFSETNHNFGTVSRNAKTEHTFVIENCFEEDVHISSVRSSCGCTKPVLTKNSLKSWEKGEIIAQFNTRAFIGTKNAEITVVIDRPYYAEVKLTVSGTIRSDVVVEPGEVRFGDVELGAKKVVDLKISYAGRTDWKISDIRGNSNHVEVRLDPVQRKGTLTNYLLHITLKESAPAGEMLDELIVVTNDEKNEQFTLPLSARVIPPVSVSPVFVALGDVGQGKSVQNRLIVRSKKPFAITEVACADSRFDFTLPEGTKSLHIIPFSFKGEVLDGKDNGAIKEKILVKTSLGEDMSAEVTVAGRVVH